MNGWNGTPTERVMLSPTGEQYLLAYSSRSAINVGNGLGEVMDWYVVNVGK